MIPACGGPTRRDRPSSWPDANGSGEWFARISFAEMKCRQTGSAKRQQLPRARLGNHIEEDQIVHRVGMCRHLEPDQVRKLRVKVECLEIRHRPRAVNHAVGRELGRDTCSRRPCQPMNWTVWGYG